MCEVLVSPRKALACRRVHLQDGLELARDLRNPRLLLEAGILFRGGSMLLSPRCGGCCLV